uniref:Transmembrane protein n=1 Tax=Rhipicephalus appendiculatus TaxID=34631 RepID=A0A131YD41_RHIAP
MAASEHRQTEAEESAAGDEWVCVKDGGDGVNELLLKEIDGDATGEKESIPNAPKEPESARVRGRFLRLCRLAWNDILSGDDFWDYFRAYVLGGALCVNTALHYLTVLATLAESSALRVLLTCTGHFAMAIVCTAALSLTTRFLSLLAAKASYAGLLVFDLLVTNVVILLAACFACIYEVRAGIMLFPELDLGWLADMARMQALVVALLLGPSLLVLTGTDVGTTLRALCFYWRYMREDRKPSTRRWPLQLKRSPGLSRSCRNQ